MLGPGGRGLAHGLEGRDNVVTLHTCGKALGLSGALVCLPRVLREFLINRCRNFIFATAPSPLLAAAIRAALGVIERADDRRAALAERVRRVGEALRRLTDAEPSGTHIQPVIVGSDKRALALAERMQAHGHDIRAIRPPTVPEGTARLRISLTLNVSDAQTDAMIALLAQELAALPS